MTSLVNKFAFTKDQSMHVLLGVSIVVVYLVIGTLLIVITYIFVNDTTKG